MMRFWSSEIDVGEELAARLIAQQFPDLAPVALRRFGAGMDNAAFLVNERYVFRFPRREFAVPLLERETRVLPLIAPHVPVPIPVPRFIGAPSASYPSVFAGYERLPGTSACSVTLPHAARHALAPALGAFLRALHTLDAGPAIERGLPGDLIGRFDHVKRLALAKERFAVLEAAGFIDDAQPFIDLLARIAPGDLSESRTIVHGDLYARHVLLDESGSLAGIIDWGDVHVGHAAADLMIAHTMLPANAHGAFLEAYGSVDAHTWDLAKYRATYHCALVADYGVQINDAALRDAGLTGLQFIRETL